MAKIPFITTIKNRFGEEVQERDPTNPKETKAVTVGTVCVNVLDTTLPSDQSEKLKDKMRRWDLIKAITASEESFTPAEILDSDVDYLCARIGTTGMSAQVIGFVVEHLQASKTP